MIIGISGKIGAGKDAIAAHLVKQHSFQIVRFSDALKEEVLRIMRKTCEEICQVYAQLGGGRMIDKPNERQLRYLLWDAKPPIMRRMLQEWGTELRRNEQPGYWVARWTIKVHQLKEKNISVVTPDVRFNDEAAAIRRAGGIVLRVERPGLSIGDHASETEADSLVFDHVIQNDGTLDDLARRVDAYLASL